MRSRRVGADPAFAKAMARSEFGRFYADDQQLREVWRSFSRADARRKPKPERPEASEPELTRGPKAKSKLWHQPRVRERRTELAHAMARIAAAAKLRKKEGETE